MHIFYENDCYVYNWRYLTQILIFSYSDFEYIGIEVFWECIYLIFIRIGLRWEVISPGEEFKLSCNFFEGEGILLYSMQDNCYVYDHVCNQRCGDIIMLGG